MSHLIQVPLTRIVASGASTGKFEALERCDGDRVASAANRLPSDKNIEQEMPGRNDLMLGRQADLDQLLLNSMALQTRPVWA